MTLHFIFLFQFTLPKGSFLNSPTLTARLYGAVALRVFSFRHSFFFFPLSFFFLFELGLVEVKFGGRDGRHFILTTTVRDR